MLTEKMTSSELAIGAIMLELEPRTKPEIVGHRTSMFSRVPSIKLYRIEGRRVARYDIHGCSLQGLRRRRAEVERKRATEGERGRGRRRRRQKCQGKGQREESRKRKRGIEEQRGRGRGRGAGEGERKKKKREKKRKKEKEKERKKNFQPKKVFQLKNFSYNFYNNLQ